MNHKRTILILLTILLTSANCHAKHLYKESAYRDYWCAKNNGVIEYKLRTGERVDCLLPDYAVELDFARKWNECVGQALNYAAALDINPKCVLIIENPQKERKYINRMDRRIKKYYQEKYPGFIFTYSYVTINGLERYLKKNIP